MLLRIPKLCRLDLNYVTFNPNTSRCYIEDVSGWDFSVRYDGTYRNESPCRGINCTECVFGKKNSTEEEALKMFKKLTGYYTVDKKLLIV